MSKPLCIDLFCGLGGWADGFLAEGYDVIGFDIERHRYPGKCKGCDGTGNFYRHDEDGDYLPCDDCNGAGEAIQQYPAQLVLQDVLTLHGSQFKDAACIVASPPCQEYSLWGMRMFHPNPPIPDKRLWEAAVRIGHQAGVPLVIENVRGAQYWWGRAAWKSGPYYLWGDVPAIWPYIDLKRKRVVDDVKNGQRRGLPNLAQRFGSKTQARAQCTAEAAKIPQQLSSWIAQCFKPHSKEAVA